MQRTLGTIMGTKLESQPDDSFAAGTYSDRYIDGVNYLNNLYPKTQEISEIFDIDKVKTEIHEGRPVIMAYGGACSDGNGGYVDCDESGHAIVIHGYMGNIKLIGNFGWGPNSAHRTLDFNGNYFNTDLPSSYYSPSDREGYFRRFHFVRF
ncbi:hypothetical protein DLH72_02430 [Candidatus Gracilibacteria bacterium]|nr:MAG: hypothetical protein DLH72_02430 [Candidatus Gracilibacteria bacterium]